jgi:histidyl-tRNA synthetase
MMIDPPRPDRINVAVVAENPAREADALAMTMKLRRAGIAAEPYVAGSPRKRYDRAMKANPASIVSLDVRDGAPTQGFRLLDSSCDEAARAQSLVEAR